MKNVLLTSVAALALATTSHADTTVGGDIELTIKENAAGNYAGSMDLDLDVTAGEVGTIALGFDATPGTSVSVDTWTLGSAVGPIGVQIGNDNGAWVEAEGEHTLSKPTLNTGVQVYAYGAKIALGLTDWTNDVADLQSIQGSYTMEISSLSVTGAVDHNLDSGNNVLGLQASGLGVVDIATVGGAFTYDMDAESYGYEGVATVMNTLTAYVNGDDAEMLQNIGGKATRNIGGLDLTGKLNYNMDAEEIQPSVVVGFSF